MRSMEVWAIVAGVAAVMCVMFLLLLTMGAH